MLEAYQAFGDYHTMMDLTERVILNALDALGGQHQLPVGRRADRFHSALRRRTYHELLQEHTGIAPGGRRAVRAYAEQIGLETAGKHPDLIKSEVSKPRSKTRCGGRCFVVDYPASICPLTKRKRDNPEVAERFELFIQGMEIANAIPS